MLELKICNQSHIVPRNPIHLSYKKYMEQSKLSGYSFLSLSLRMMDCKWYPEGFLQIFPPLLEGRERQTRGVVTTAHALILSEPADLPSPKSPIQPFSCGIGLVWQGTGGGGATGVASVESCQKLPPTLTEPLPASSKLDLPQNKAKPIRGVSNTSVITYLWGKKREENRRCCSEVTVAREEQSENT